MAEKPKPKAKATRKSKFADKAQSERFIEAARELGADDTTAFDETFKRIATTRMVHRRVSSKRAPPRAS